MGKTDKKNKEHQLCDYFRGIPNEKGKEIFEQWTESLLADSRNISIPKSLGDKIKAGIEKKTSLIVDRTPLPHLEKRKQKALFYKIAASLLVLASIGFLARQLTSSTPVLCYTDKLCTVFVPNGVKQKISLSDGTLIVLNSGSELSFPKHFNGPVREVRLTGEAFFQVAKDSARPFVVSTGSVCVTVLGTSFNIEAYTNSNSRVTVTDGRVQVSAAQNGASGAENIILKEGEQSVFRLSEKSISKTTANVDERIGWLQGKITFSHETLQEAFATLERSYALKINCTDTGLLKETVKASYQNASFITVMDDLKFIAGFEYHFQPDGTILVFNPYKERRKI
ncbi:MAG: FecR domain-containing protein [Bacteroidales bacterium]|nr:FecR domain-containing protein [Bacteroidales bacterium]